MIYPSILSLPYLLSLALFVMAFRMGRVAPRRRRWALLAANLVFLAVTFVGGESHLLVFLAGLLANYACLRWLSAEDRGAWPVAALIACYVALLGFAQAPRRAPWLAALPNPRLFIVLGASFMLLRLIHLAAEAADGGLSLDLLDYLNYLLLFPAFFAGPVDRYERFQAEARSPRPPSWKGAYESACRTIEGFFKIMVLARPLNIFSWAQMSASEAAHLAAWQSALAIFACGAQIYLSFSGATDLAIGLSGFMGVELPENFNRPFLARNLQDFWSRWHTSFVAWLRDYLYYPAARLFGRWLAPVFASFVALLATFVLAGAWHGYGWNFACYGGYHAAGFAAFMGYRSVLERVLTPRALESYRQSRVVRILAGFLTLAFVFGGLFLYLDRASVALALLRRAR